MVKKAFIAVIFVSMLSIGISAAEDEDMKTIVDTAAAYGSFNTLVSAVEVAGLTDDLNGEGPFTVFAPTDDAFAKAEGLDVIDTDVLTKILTYHVADSEYMASDVGSMTAIPTLEGANLTVEVTDEGLTVGGANVTATDILCSNGVIHVIDAVLMPPAARETVEAEEIVEETIVVEVPAEETTTEVEG